MGLASFLGDPLARLAGGLRSRRRRRRRRQDFELMAAYDPSAVRELDGGRLRFFSVLEPGDDCPAIDGYLHDGRDVVFLRVETSAPESGRSVGLHDLGSCGPRGMRAFTVALPEPAVTSVTLRRAVRALGGEA